MRRIQRLTNLYRFCWQITSKIPSMNARSHAPLALTLADDTGHCCNAQFRLGAPSNEVSNNYNWLVLLCLVNHWTSFLCPIVVSLILNSLWLAAGQFCYCIALYHNFIIYILIYKTHIKALYIFYKLYTFSWQYDSATRVYRPHEQVKTTAQAVP